MPTVPGDPNPYLESMAKRQQEADTAAMQAQIPVGDNRVDNPYLLRLQSRKLSADMASNAAILPAMETTPDDYAQNLALARETKLPVGVVQTDPAAVAAEHRRTRIAEAVSKSPILQAWMATDDNAMLAIDDAEQLSGLAYGLRAVGDVLKSPFRGFDVSLGQGIQGMGALNDVAARKIEQGVRMIPGVGDPVADAIATPIPWWANPSNWARGLGREVEELGGAPLSEDRRNIATDVGEGLGTLIGQAVATRLNPTAGTALMAGQGAEQQLERATAAGADQSAADTAVLYGSVITAATERIGLDKLLNRMPPQIKNRAAQWIVDKAIAGGIEGGQEAVEAVANNVVAGMLYEPDSPIFAGVQDNATVGAAVGVIARTLFGVRSRGYEAQDVQAQQEVLDGLVKGASATKLSQLAPERLSDLLGKLAANGAENVYVPAEAVQTLFQSEEPARVAFDLGVPVETYLEAILTGGDIAIPVGSYLTKVAPQHHDALREVARFTPGAMTPEETAQMDEQAQAAADQFMASVQSTQPSDAKVYEDVTGMLLGTGRYRREDVEKYAQLVQAGFRTLGAREGIDPFQLYQQYRLRIKAELPAALQRTDIDTVIDPLIERLRTGDRPRDPRQTLADFIADTGGVTDATLTGELASLNESDRVTRRGKKRLVREDAGRDLDRAREAAAEAGYLPEDSDVNDLLALLDQEMSGRPVFAQGDEGGVEVDTIRALDSLEEELGRRGIDVTTASNADIKAALFGSGDVASVPDELVQVFDQPAFHGTHDDAARGIQDAGGFKLQKIGTGEGAQAFGWGLYFASHKDVAESYRRQLSGINARPGAKMADEAMTAANGDRAEALRSLQNRKRRAKTDRERDEVSSALYVMRQGFRRGQTYQVEVPDDGDLLDYDKPLSAQPEKVRAALAFPESEPFEVIETERGYGVQNTTTGEMVVDGHANRETAERIASNLHSEAWMNQTGKQYYQRLTELNGSERGASEELLAAGIPGLRYLDGMSRGTGGTHNYVIWDEKAVSEPVALYQSQAGGDQTETEAFKRWFGDSKVVDADGNPLVVYHGTNQSFDSFSDERHGQNTSSASSIAFFFTESPAEANEYAELAGRTQIADAVNVEKQSEEIQRKISHAESRSDWDTAERLYLELEELELGAINADPSGQNIMPVYLSIQNPMVLDMGDSFDGHRVRDAIAEAEAAGYDGLKLLNVYDPVGLEGRAAAGLFTTTQWIALRDTQIKSATANRGTFDPNDPSILNQSDRNAEAIKRGYIKFGGARAFTIGLLKDADATTFLHETGHFFLEVMGDLATDPNASAGIIADYQAALDWLGVADRSEIKTEHHEKWARGFEAYLGEGKAPSPELASAFSRFKAWVKAIYRTLTALNVELSDDVRGVFDRLLATDEEITQAEQSMDYAPLFADARSAGWSDAEFATRLRLNDEAREEAETRLMTRAMRDVTRETKAWWKERSDDVRAEVTAEVQAQPVYRAWAMLANGTQPDGTPIEGADQKLDKGWLVRQYGQEWLNKNLLRKRVYSVENGLDPDVVALGIGFDSGDAMVKALANAQPMNAVIAAETHRRMVEQYGDVLTDGTLPEQAMRAVHGTRRFKAMEADLKALERLTGEPRPSAAGLRRVAESIIGKKRVRDLQPNSYLRAERKAAKEAIQASGRQEWGVALEAQRRRLLNAHLYDVASKAQDETDKLNRYLRKFEKPALRARLGKIGRLEQVEALLDGYDLRRVSGRQIDREKARGELLALIQSGEITAPRSLVMQLQNGRRQNWRDLTVEELRGLRDVLAQTEAAAKAEYEAFVNGERVRIDEKADQVAASTLAGGESVMPAYGAISPDETVKQYGKQALLSWLRPSALARMLDGGQDDGAWTRNIIQPIRQAMVEKLEPMKRQAQEALSALYLKHYTKKEMAQMNERAVVPGLGLPLSRWDVISLALNWGNAENRKAILDSEVAGRRPYTEAGVQTALATLDARDWAFVQDTWDYVDSYWGQIKEAQTRRKGIAPPKVEAVPFVQQTRDGQVIELQGGYYPLKYNSRLDARARQNEMDEAFERMRAGTLSATQTKYGHNQARVGSGRQPVLLSMNVLHNHINSVVQDLALGDAVNYVDRVLTRPQVRQALIETGNLDALETLKLWLKDTATGEIGARSGIEQMAQLVRFGFTKSKIGFNLVTVGLQITGLAQTVPVIGWQPTAVGAAQFAKNPRSAIRQIMEQSAFMRSRYELNNFNKDIAAVQDALRSGAPVGKGSGFIGGFIQAVRAAQLPPQLVNWAFLGIRTMQIGVDSTTWLAGYTKANANGLPHDEAVRYADGIVENAQTSGMFSDRSAIERGTFSETTRQSEFVKLWTTLMSYMIAKGNIAYESYRRNDLKSVNGALSFGQDMLLLFLVEAILMGAIKGGWPGDDEDWFTWTGKTVAEQAVSTVPIVREIPSFYKGYGAGGGPLGATLSDMARAGQQTQQGEVDAALVKSYINLIGTATGIPSAQINRGVDAYWRENVDGEEVPAYEYVVGKRKE
jgi:hypothetical protein